MVGILAPWLPGLWVGLLVVALALALRRWFDPLPWPIVALHGLVVVALLHSVLFGGRLLLPLDNLRGAAPFQGLLATDPAGNFLQGDLIQLVLPSLAAVRRALAAGEWPLWHPLVGLGMPLLADPQAQALQPLQLLALPLSLATAPGAVAALRIELALTFCFLFARRQNLGAGPAFAASLAYGLGGFLQLWLGWPLANTAALLPLVLYAVVRAAAVGGRRDLALLSVGLAALLLAGHPETILYALATALLLALAELRALPPDRRRRRLAGVAGAVVFAGLATAPVLLPTLDDLPSTQRAALLRSRLIEPSAGGARAVAVSAAQLFVPNLLGNSRYADSGGVLYRGRFNSAEDAAGFAGTLAWLLALAGIAARPRLPRELLFQFLGAAVLLALVVATGIGFVLPLRLGLILNLCVAFLAGATLSRLGTGAPGRLRLLTAALAFALLLAAATWAQLRVEDPGGLRLLQLGTLAVQLRVLVAAAAVLVFFGGRRWAAGAAAALLAYELFLVHGPANPAAPAGLFRPVSPALEFLAKQVDGGRIAALGTALTPNLAGLWGLADARVYNPMAPEAYRELTAPLVVAPQSNIPEWGQPQHPLYDLLGVRFLLSPPGANLGPPWHAVLERPEATVWERASRGELCFLPDQLLASAAPLGCAQSLAEPRRAACLAALADGAQAWRAPLGPTPVVSSVWRGGTAVTARTRIDAPRLLACSLAADPGWQGLVDGQRAALATVDGALLGSWLPAGSTRLDLLYRPRGFLAGCGLAALAWAVLLAAASRPPVAAASTRMRPDAHWREP